MGYRVLYRRHPLYGADGAVFYITEAVWVCDDDEPLIAAPPSPDEPRGKTFDWAEVDWTAVVEGYERLSEVIREHIAAMSEPASGQHKYAVYCYDDIRRAAAEIKAAEERAQLSCLECCQRIDSYHTEACPHSGKVIAEECRQAPSAF